MGLNTIADLIQKRGSDYLEKLLEGELVISEKLDTFRIQFEKKDGELIFFKKDNSPITLIERTLDDTWEQALIEIPTLIGKTKLPEGIRYGVAYTPVERPLRIPYTNLPKYILTDITKRDGDKIIETYDYDEVKHWAGILCMGRPPVLFEGELNEDQKNLITDYGTGKYEGEYESFSELITKTLKSSYSKENIIEGIVIKNGKNIAQVVSYEFELLNEAYKKKTNSSRDFYDVVMLSLIDFMDSYKLPKLTTENKDEMYIEIVNDIFNKYCKKERIDENFDPKYLTPPSFGTSGKLNKKFIKNEETIKNLEKDEIYEAFYRVILSSFKKYKKPYGLLTEHVIDKFNNYVGVINNAIHEEINIVEYVNEYIDYMSNTRPINEARSENVSVRALKRRQPNDIDNMRVVASVQSAFLPREAMMSQGKERVAIYLTSYKPFTNSQRTNIEQIRSQWNVPVILAAVSKDRELKGSEFHLSDGVVRGQMRSLSNFNKEVIPSYMMLNSWSLKEIFQFCRPHYEPLIIFTDKGKKAELALQLFYEEEVMGGTLNVLPEFNIGEMENKDALPALRMIEDGNGSGFMEITPGSVHNFYDQIINEYRTWEGAIPHQFEPIKYPEIDR
jgi:hypothetical protein